MEYESPIMNQLNDRHQSWSARFSQAAATLLALAVLAGVGWWGHHSGWRLPSFSTLSGQAEAQEESWCAEHGVPADECVACNPSLEPFPTDYGWCAEHGVHQCTIDHPELAQTPSTPTVTQEDRQRVEKALAVRDRVENNNRCPLYRERIQFASTEAMDKIGVDVALVEKHSIIETVDAPAEIVYDPTRMARLSARAPGTVWRAEKQVGDAVAAGEVIALVDAAQVGMAKSKLLQSNAQVELTRQTVERLKKLRGDVVSEAKVLEAEAALKNAEADLIAARQTLVNLGLPIDLQTIEGISQSALTNKLQFLGLPETITQNLDPKTTTNNLLPVAAPFAGVVVERNVVTGEHADSEKPLYVIADTTQLWLRIDVPQEEIASVEPGREVLFHSDVGEVETSGTINWLSTVTNDLTRTVDARAVLKNPNGKLRANTFGQARIVLRREPHAPMVPNAALQWDGSCHIVFVRDKHFFEEDAPKLFYTRTVRPGVVVDGLTEIIVGVLPGEVVATEGSGVMRAQLLRNNLGAG